MTDASAPQRRSRLVATIGPASADRLAELVGAGLDVARINLSHGSHEDHHVAAGAVRAAAAAAGRPIGLLVDLPGPKLRLGSLPDDEVDLDQGTEVSLGHPDDGRADLPLADADVLDALEPGDRVLLADGAAELRVVRTGGPGSRRVGAEVVRGGIVRSRQGVSVPAERLAAGALPESDEQLLPHLLDLEPDFVGQSFVRTADDVELLRARLPREVAIVAKIETRPAVDAIESILGVADAIMVARGDLGVELPFEQVPLVQKDLLAAAMRAGRASIVATQMLESMIEAPRPTRAEASDVANAILDGADAVMLSAETAVGRWPLESLRAAAAIARATDVHAAVPVRPPDMSPDFETDPDARATAIAAVTMADEDPAVGALACITRSGRTARLLASMRPRVPIVAFTESDACARSLALRRGVQAVRLEPDAASTPERVRAAFRDAITGWRLPTDGAVVLVRSSRGGAPDTVELMRPHA